MIGIGVGCHAIIELKFIAVFILEIPIKNRLAGISFVSRIDKHVFTVGKLYQDTVTLTDIHKGDF